MQASDFYGDRFSHDHYSVNLLEHGVHTPLPNILPNLEYSKYRWIAISAYIWNEYLIHKLLHYLRKEKGFAGEFILGGYQISYSGNPQLDYPEADIFVSGYGEESLLRILTTDSPQKIWKEDVPFENLPSPYLSGAIPLEVGQKMIRWETKRGCPYKCSFCAHRDLANSKVNKHNLDRIYEELHLFHEMDVQKINILDPIFNVGKGYLEILKEMDRIGYRNLVSIQSRFELIGGDRGEEFLDLCENLNINLEFGLQTSDKLESSLINRKNDPTKIQHAMHELNTRNISYEISLMFGLPNQTVESFQRSIDFVIDNGCENITAYPLKLLRGTKLESQREEFQFREMTMGDFDIPFVVESNSFSEADWWQMKELADSLEPSQRVIKVR
ncbi:MAG: radical SAM protein [Leptospira sp.]|nr:radical SAM protein [Leptospira sp.]